jgi:hypothetical protein
VDCPGQTIHCFDVNLEGGDCAEEFDVLGDEQVDPGTVLVLTEDGLLRASGQPYDRKVAGVVSGAGGYKPGILLDRTEQRGSSSAARRVPVALVGKVYCKVDATSSAVAVGDLLTTSQTPGHAMRVADPSRGFGAVLGKALRSLKEGRGLIPILVALQ